MTLPFPPELEGSGTNKHCLKTALRQEIKTKRQQLSTTPTVLLNLMQITKHEEWLKAKHIGFYWAIKAELPVTSLIEQAFLQDKNCYLPRTTKDKIDFISYNFKQELIPDYNQILCPDTDEIRNNLDLIIVPCIGLHKSGHRIGYGKGYYDKFLANSNAFTIAVAYKAQEYEADVHEVWDVACKLALFC